MPVDLQLGEGFPSPEDNASGLFRFLNEPRLLGRPADWRQPEASRLWRYHLHYLEWAWSFARHEDRAWARTAFGILWQSWDESAPFGRGDEWAPYVVSLRAWVLCGVYDKLIRGSDIDRDVVTSLARHASFLRWHVEHDVGGNHLIKNLKALVGLGVFLGHERLAVTAAKHLERQLPVQVLSDGGHYERSPSYHCQVLGDLIDIDGLLSAAGRSAVPGLAGAIDSMRTWLGRMLMPDGDVPLFNDCVLVGRDRLALLRPRPPATARLTVLAASGYVVMRPDDRLHLVADVGDPCPPDLPAHAHADCLSFELAVDGERFVVDSGTSTYVPGAQRAQERSTAAHNTVSVDGSNQTEVWSTFRAARLARARLDRADDDGVTITVTAEHDGYLRLPGGAVHRRTWEATTANVMITDEVLGRGKHRIESRVHLATAGPARLEWSGPADLVITESMSECATGFGSVRNCQVASAAWQGDLPMTIRTDLHFDDSWVRRSDSTIRISATSNDMTDQAS